MVLALQTMGLLQDCLISKNNDLKSLKFQKFCRCNDWVSIRNNSGESF